MCFLWSHTRALVGGFEQHRLKFLTVLAASSWQWSGQGCTPPPPQAQSRLPPTAPGLQALGDDDHPRCPRLFPFSSLKGHLLLDLGLLRTQDDTLENFSDVVSAEPPFPRKVPEARRQTYLARARGGGGSGVHILLPTAREALFIPAPLAWLGCGWNKHGTGLSTPVQCCRPGTGAVEVSGS